MKNPFTKSGPAILLLATLFPNSQMASDRASCPFVRRAKLFTAENIVAWSAPSVVDAFFYESGLAIDADGAPRAYHPNDRLGLDSLAHADHRGNWWALVTDNEKTNGTPVV
jgi:hypothetical protein